MLKIVVSKKGDMLLYGKNKNMECDEKKIIVARKHRIINQSPYFKYCYLNYKIDIKLYF